MKIMSRSLWLAVLVLATSAAAAEDVAVASCTLAAGDQAVAKFDLNKAVAAYRQR